MEVAAASIAVVQIADRVLTLCKAYIDGVRDAPDDFRLILIEVSSLKPILKSSNLSLQPLNLLLLERMPTYRCILFYCP